MLEVIRGGLPWQIGQGYRTGTISRKPSTLFPDISLVMISSFGLAFFHLGWQFSE